MAWKKVPKLQPDEEQMWIQSEFCHAHLKHLATYLTHLSHNSLSCKIQNNKRSRLLWEPRKKRKRIYESIFLRPTRALNKCFLFLSKNFQVAEFMANTWTSCKEYLSFPNYYVNDQLYRTWISYASSDSFKIFDKWVTKNIAIWKLIIGLHPLKFIGEICSMCYTCRKLETHTCSWLTNINCQHSQHLWFIHSSNNKSQLNGIHIKQKFKFISSSFPRQEVKQFVHK